MHRAPFFAAVGKSFCAGFTPGFKHAKHGYTRVSEGGVSR